MPALYVLALGAYLFGSIPTANILARAFRGVDLREFGSQAVTSSNVGVLMGTKGAVAAGLLDIFKGAAPVWLAQALGVGLAGQMVVGLMVVAGHNWSIFLKFQGGRGLATVIGVVMATAPWLLVLMGVFVLLGIIVFRNTPVIFGLGTVLLPFWAYSLNDDPPLVWGTALLAIAVIIKRLAGNSPGSFPREGIGHVLLYRLLYDRDVKEREEWIHRPGSSDQPGNRQQPPAGEPPA